MENNLNQNNFSEQETGFSNSENKPLKKIWESPQITLIGKDDITSKISTPEEGGTHVGPHS